MTNQELYDYLVDLKDPEGWSVEQIYKTFIFALEHNPTPGEAVAWKIRVDKWVSQLRPEDD